MATKKKDSNVVLEMDRTAWQKGTKENRADKFMLNIELERKLQRSHQKVFGHQFKITRYQMWSCLYQSLI